MLPTTIFAQTQNIKISEAINAMKSHLASTVTVKIDSSSLKLKDLNNDSFYYVCGLAIVNNPGFTNDEKQRFIVSFNKSISDGMALFDGSNTVTARENFQSKWKKNCL